MSKQYLGDSVWCETNRYGQIVLTTENGDGPPSNTIILEPEVYAALVEYVTAQALKDTMGPRLGRRLK